MLEGMRVVELSNDVAGGLTGRLLAAYGADVIVVEPPGGHATRQFGPRSGPSPDESILFAYLGSGKRSAVFDLNDAGDRDVVRRLALSADVVIDSYAPGALAARGLDPAKLIAENPRLVVCSIAPFGQSGPRANWRLTAIGAAAAGGQMAVCGDPGMPPLKTAGYQGHYQAGLHAFSAVLAAVLGVRRHGAGDWLDISIQEVQASTLEGTGPGALNEGNEAGRSSGNRTFAQWGIHECKGGYIGVAAMPRQTYAIYDCIGHPELKEDPALASGWSADANELLTIYLPEWTAERTAEEIFAEAAKFRAPFAIIPNPRELLEWPGLKDTGFWQEVDHPVLGKHPLPSAPIAMADGSRGSAAPAPLLGQHTEAVRAEVAKLAPAAAAAAPAGALPLAFDGIRITDVTQVWAGPYATRFLADLGAEVIKVEGPSFADPIRTMGGARQAPEINQSHYFNEYNRNKEGISLDIKQPQGMEALRRLIAASDVFIENWSSGVADRLGLGFEDVRALNPRIVYVSMPGFGHTGPDAERIGFGPTIEQMGGLVALQGYEGGAPHRSGISYGDPISGTIAAGAVAMLLAEREKTGAAQYAMIPQRDAIPSLIGEYIVAEALGHPLPMRIGAHDAEWAPHNVYQARDSEPRAARTVPTRPPVIFTDTWLAIAVDSEQAWSAFKRIVGDSRLDDAAFGTMASRHANQERLDAIIAEWAATQEHGEAAAALQAAGVAACPVLTPLMIANDAHLAARGFFVPYTHPDTGECRASRPAWQWSRRPSRPLRAAPQFGQYTRPVLKRVLGYSEAQLDEMAATAVITDDLIPGAAG